MAKLTIKACMAVLLGLALSGCSKLNKENYDKLKMGMNQDDVEAILGIATDCSERLGTLSCHWGDLDGKHIKINFIAGNAVMFSHEGLVE